MPFFTDENSRTSNAGKEWSYSNQNGISRYEARQGDYYDSPYAADGSGDEELGKNRSEQNSFRSMQLGREFSLTMEFMVEDGPANTAAWMVLTQFHQTEDIDADGNIIDAVAAPPVVLAMRGEKLVIITRTSNEATLVSEPESIDRWTDTEDLVRGVWHSVKMDMVFDPAPGGAGKLAVWIDGVQVVDHAGPTGYNDVIGPYLATGVYRAEAPEAFAAQFRNVDVVAEGPPPAMNGTDAGDFINANRLGFWENEVLNGFDGDDTLDGGFGADTMNGGAGDDVYIVNDAGDVVNETSRRVDAGGTDLVRSYVSYTLADGVENIFLQDAADIDATGNGLANTVQGNDGNNLLRGMGGDDLVLGRTGDDRLFGGTGADRLYGGTGADRLYGEDGNDTLFGEDGNDRLYGGIGDDSLDGGDGFDIMEGGAGNDQYSVDQIGDRVVEATGGGSDTVRASVSFDADEAGEIEVINAADLAGTGALNLSGDNSANELRGNNGANRLDGRGGNDLIIAYAGNDTLIGGSGNDSLQAGEGNDLLQGGAGHDTLRGDAGTDSLYGGDGNDLLYTGEGAGGLVEGGGGNDTYYIDAANTTIHESAGGGTDTIRASVSITLEEDDEVEVVLASSITATTALDFTGSNSANELRGNNGANRLDGRGGADNMFGYGGNDIYHVDNAGDRVNEVAGNGTDTVLTEVNFQISSTQSIEVLEAANRAGTAGLTLGGNDAANIIRGNAGNNFIQGRGGNDSIEGAGGNDTVQGGAGTDTAVFEIASTDVGVVRGASSIVLTLATGTSSVSNDVENFQFTDRVLSYGQLGALTGQALSVGLVADQTGGAGFDHLIGDDAAEVLFSMGGNDWITPGNGDDTVDGGDGTDMLNLGTYGQAVIVDLGAGTVRSGADTKIVSNIENVTGSIYSDFLTGDAGDNWMRALGGYDWFITTDGADTYDGSNGRDMLTYIYADEGVTVDLGQQRGLSGQAATHTYVEVERATGSIHADVFYGSDGSDEFRGAGGYDVFYDSEGRDRYDGGTGLDTVDYSRSAGGVNASLLRGSGGPNYDLYLSIENLNGSRRDDALTGDHGRNVLRGWHGDDALNGMGGNDYLEGGSGNDVMDGGAGYDVALYRNAASQYTVSTVGDVTTVTHAVDGIDTLTNIEALRFTDGFDYL